MLQALRRPVPKPQDLFSSKPDEADLKCSRASAEAVIHLALSVSMITLAPSSSNIADLLHCSCVPGCGRTNDAKRAEFRSSSRWMLPKRNKACSVEGSRGGPSAGVDCAVESFSKPQQHEFLMGRHRKAERIVLLSNCRNGEAYCMHNFGCATRLVIGVAPRAIPHVIVTSKPFRCGTILLPSDCLSIFEIEFATRHSSFCAPSNTPSSSKP